jgi:hypothetical protein
MGGARTGSPNARSVVAMVGGSNTAATSFMRPSHLSHLRTSILKVRLRSCAQGMRLRLPVFFLLSGELSDGDAGSRSASMTHVGLSGKLIAAVLSFQLRAKECLHLMPARVQRLDHPEAR